MHILIFTSLRIDSKSLDDISESQGLLTSSQRPFLSVKLASKKVFILDCVHDCQKRAHVGLTQTLERRRVLATETLILTHLRSILKSLEKSVESKHQLKA